MRVGLVACSARKLAHPAPAGEIYRGNLFLSARPLMRRCDEWRVLSAKWGLLKPESVIKPYNLKLHQLDSGDYTWWRSCVRDRLLAEFGKATFVFVAGAKYRTVLWPGAAEVIPGGLERLAIGKQVQRARECVMRARRVLVVGVAPSRTRSGAAFIGSGSGARLEKLLGLQAGELGEVADTANLHDTWPGPASGGNGDREPPVLDLRRAAEELDLTGYDRVVLCGRAVANAFGLRSGPNGNAIAERELRGLPALVIPHPSSVSRWWNEESNRLAAMEALRSFIPESREHVWWGSQ